VITQAEEDAAVQRLKRYRAVQEGLISLLASG